MSPLSILAVTHSYPPVLGGSEVEMQRVAKALRERGHQVQVVCAGGPPMPPVSHWVDPEQVPVRILASRWPAGPWRDWMFALGVAWLIWQGRRKYHAVYFLMQGAHLATGLPMARWCGLPILMKFSGSSIITSLTHSRLGRLELKWLRQWAHKIMVLNPGMADEAVAAGLPRQQLYWMPNPVDISVFCPNPAIREQVRAAAGLGSGQPLVVFVGRLAPEKELPSLVGAMALVATQCPDAQLILIGDGPSRPLLEAEVERRQLRNHVRFLGRQEMSEVIRWLQAADLFTLTSSVEGFPCSLVEAMSAGLPSVVSRIPANTQLIEPGVHGEVAELKNEQDLAAALVRLLTNAGRREQLGHAARQLVSGQYSTAKVAERYEELFQAACAAPRS